jgi:hypothetical protein
MYHTLRTSHTHFIGTFGAVGVVRLCLEAEPQGYYFRKALYKAIEHGFKEIIEIVLEAHPYLKTDQQALKKARKYRRLDICEMFILIIK